MKVNHINVPDDNANIFCKRINSIINLDKAGKFWKFCGECPMFNGTYQGEGVECLWEDTNAQFPVKFCTSPQSEMVKLNKPV